MDFLNISEKTFLITGVANRKSVAYFSAKTLEEGGAKLVFTVQNEKNFASCQKLFPHSPIFICDVESPESLKELTAALAKLEVRFAGLLHSIAFANYSEGPKPFHETLMKDFLQATNISCFSLVSLSNAVKSLMEDDASIVTVSISNTRATSYGYMGPIKAALDAAVAFLAKSLSEISHIRVNAVCSGPLKTSASAGIPDYINNYLYAQELTLRKEALKTQEVANSVCFLLSPASSGINASNMVIDAGMSSNYFDQKVVKTVADAL